jgi:hypothetical protein
VTLVALGRMHEAERAFEEAALIDPKFVVPPRSGAHASKLANEARKKQESLGQYHFEVGLPGTVKADEPFKVLVEMAKEQAELVALVRVTVAGSKPYDTVEPAGPRSPRAVRR